MIEISTKLAGISLKTCVFNAAGAKNESLKELEVIGLSECPAIVMKSCTLKPRKGNPKPRYAEFELGSINSMGLPNKGFKKYIEFAKKLKKKFGKPIIASVAGLTLKENLTIIQHFQKIKEIDAIEFNPACPNIPGKPIIAYDFNALKKILKKISNKVSKPLGVKLPPYFDLWQFEQASKTLNKIKKVKFVTTINSIPNGLMINAEKETTLIKPKNGFGGIGGKTIKPTALANVRKLFELLRKDIDIIGVGGIETGKDVFEFILCGAKAVQIGTIFMKEGPNSFKRINNELKKLMKKKGYSSIEEFRGKLKTL
jgi:dihydroorotate dehydrogenase (fumarate)